MAPECSACVLERKRRCQVHDGSEASLHRLRTKFAGAPYVHPYNQPKYQAQICHAVNYARANQRKVLWRIAQDWPLTADEIDLEPEKLQALRESWLLLHDVQTAGIPGLFPFSADMPVKFTDNVCREEKIFKHTSGRLKACVLSEEVTTAFQNAASGQDGAAAVEIVLSNLPEAFVVEVSEGYDEPHLYTLKPETVIWYRDKSKQAPVRRRGFQLVPDFAGTAHAYCGDTLEQCKGDLLEWHKMPTFEMMQRAYIIRSRVHATDGCLLVRPYSPALFNQGDDAA